MKRDTRPHYLQGILRLLAFMSLAACMPLVLGCEQSEPQLTNSGTDQLDPPAAGQAPAPALSTALQPGRQSGRQLHLPVSLNMLMVAMVNHAADRIWLAAWRNPQSDKDWRQLERMAVQLQVAGALLVIPGTGALDEKWTADPRWHSWSHRLRDAGTHAVDAISARDTERIAATGDEIVAICEGCHLVFKPDLPTGGAFGELSPTEADFAEPSTDP